MTSTGKIVAKYRLSIKECDYFKMKINEAVQNTQDATEKRAIGVFAEASLFKEMFVRNNEEFQQLQFINDDVRVPYKVMTKELTQEQSDTGKIRLLIQVIYKLLIINKCIWFI